MRTVLIILLVLVVLRSAAAVWQRRRCGPSWRQPQGRPAHRSPRWRPRSPADCALCQVQTTHPVPQTEAPSLQPWGERKSRRGAPKRIVTAGHACPSSACLYYGITDAHVHALIGYGHHGRTDAIQDFRCQACGTKVSARHSTALYQLKTPPARVGEVLSALAEGLDVAAAVRVFGHGEGTITRWVGRASEHARQVHQTLFHDLHLPHVQLDEIRTRLRSCGQVLWLWLACDPLTKIVPVVYLGPRSQQAAHAVVHALRAILAPGCSPLITSDGLRAYFYAVTAHFGQWSGTGRGRRWQVTPALLYGQVQKQYRRRRLVRIRYRVLCGTADRLRTTLQHLGLSGRLTTAFIERLNLTVRQSIAALARRTWSTAQTTPGLLQQVEWWRGYYHFCRPHHALRIPLLHPRWRGGRGSLQRYHPRTPAMAAGLTTHRWSTAEFLGMPCPHCA